MSVHVSPIACVNTRLCDLFLLVLGRCGTCGRPRSSHTLVRLESQSHFMLACHLLGSVVLRVWLPFFPSMLHVFVTVTHRHGVSASQQLTKLPLSCCGSHPPVHDWRGQPRVVLLLFRLRAPLDDAHQRQRQLLYVDVDAACAAAEPVPAPPLLSLVMWICCGLA